MFKRFFNWLKSVFAGNRSVELPKREQALQIPHKPKDPAWLKIARDELGEREIQGKKHNPRIVEYQQSTSLHAQDDETAWCSSFVGWCFEKAGIKGTWLANARSWLNWGVRLHTPKLGCVVILWRSSRLSWKGHVGLYVGEEGDYILLLGGNQSDSVCVSKFPKKRVLEYRWPSALSAY